MLNYSVAELRVYCEVEYVLFINMLYNSELYMMVFLVVICVGMGCNHELLNE